MDTAQSFIFDLGCDLGWIFFAAWGMVIAAVSFIAFRADLAELVSGRDSAVNRSTS